LADAAAEIATVVAGLLERVRAGELGQAPADVAVPAGAGAGAGGAGVAVRAGWL